MQCLRAVASFAVVVAVVASWPRPATAYVRSLADDRTPLSWHGLFWRVHLPAEENPRFSNARLERAVRLALDSWNHVLGDCSGRTLAIDPNPVAVDVGLDGKNVIVWRLPGFCDDPAHQTRESCRNGGAAATTTVFFRNKPGSSSDGEIIEADMELSADNFTFDDTGEGGAIDLDSVLVHETGHALGLEHTCLVAPTTPGPDDDKGSPVPPCWPVARLSREVQSAVMYNFTAPGNISKRAPGPDEAKAACDIYAHTETTGITGEDNGIACRYARRAPGSAGMVAAIAALAALVVRRRWPR